jgi:hypothetical protein
LYLRNCVRIQPSAVTAGASIEELEKRISAKLIESAPAILIDNVNGRALRPDLLASAISERPAEIRILGKTEMAKLNASSFGMDCWSPKIWRGDLLP